MRILCVGGGPASLFFSILMKKQDPRNDITVYERNRRGDTFGFGVVFSDETLANVAESDAESIAAIESEFRYWSAMDVRYRGRTITSDGHGFAALARVRLLDILTGRATDLGVKVEFETEADIDDLAGDADLVVAGDGVNSGTRSRYHQQLQPTISHGSAKYIWTATDAPFDRFTFIFEDTDHGTVQAHVYPFDDTRSTFIVEMAEATWNRAQLHGHDRGLAVGESDGHALQWCGRIFERHLEGRALIGNNSKWISFPRVSCQSWVVDNIVLLGDACHTAHYSVGSGTKMALEDAIALADAMAATGDIATALKDFETGRRPAVASLQRAAATSEEWFQHVDHHRRRPFEQFAFSLFTRSQRVTYDNLRERDPCYVDATLRWFASCQPQSARPPTADTPPIFYPFALRGVTFHNRIGVSPMAQYCAVDGMPNDWHLVHLGSRAVGGAGLVMTEMTCTSPDARITPGCTGIWNDEQTEAWAAITAFVHEHTEAKIGLQIGHAGRKGSTKVPWEEMDAPLEAGNWPLVSASAVPYRSDSQTPAEMSYTQMDSVLDDFVAAAGRAAHAGFDLLEIHAAHGYLVSSFLSPVTNRRNDDHSGSLQNRARFPLRVVAAVREAWPDTKPLSVRISATDWVPGGFGRSEAIELSRMLKDHGVDIVDVSTGQVDLSESPAFGRLYQTPFAEAIRNTVGIPTMAVGAISSIDDVNTVLMAGRADLCLIARGHLVDPYWTLNAAIDLGRSEQPWPKQYWAGRTSRRRIQVPDALIDRDLR
ncbi:MAG: bifunctional salicylyl-CoA 5-hydroxylase/oxidoreductase [Acidimicrobiaceae bacterium]|nr:bifunctional salicylyl-CoA 5-hydroxylase/oxidoreductase [Acidimicrobiaceae bacterium]MYE98573.1 bifunctional salicylyl-CoA 5-hydroxylase/oxidoreductase [Acidimicrobiaceae bacterium]MYH43491.1 bifunctional salicylyl-CoA 5-hydroxylase/oxidoreductase [Acidimicrobiaceae bacterium]MYI54730.1 bifunctional salicylyl-CoA 5-hydroxylase/oxidoreductase [Acidimicrobiaceae bacterium]MYJ80975.1 bifunctional salicylyl-CoA 5-hydroxylase/oxidoreductase [Acidimicrobiaceae bacterium]